MSVNSRAVLPLLLLLLLLPVLPVLPELLLLLLAVVVVVRALQLVFVATVLAVETDDEAAVLSAVGFFRNRQYSPASAAKLVGARQQKCEVDAAGEEQRAKR